MTIANSTITDNSTAGDGGGINVYDADVVLQRNLIAGNKAGGSAPEVMHDPTEGTLSANSHNLFGHDGAGGMVGFTPGATDIVPEVRLAAILNSQLATNSGPTRTHALVAGSPALDAAPNAACDASPIDGVDQRFMPRNQNGKGSGGSKECDIGAFEAQGVPPPPPKLYVSPSTAGNVSGIAARPEDILSFDLVAETWGMYFDGGDMGLNKALSAFAILPNGHLLLTFKANVTLPGVGAVTPWDVVRFAPTSLGNNTAGTFDWYIDGSDVGLTAAGEKIDGIDVLPDGQVLISAGGALAVAKPGGGTLKMQDEDMATFVPTATGANTAGSWRQYFNGTAIPGMKPEDIGGVAVDAASEYIYVSFVAPFNIAGIAGDVNDVLRFKPVYGGYEIERVWRGPNHGFNLTLSGIERQ